MDGQMNIYDFLNNNILEDYKIRKPIKLIELFGGIGAQAKALEVLGANFEHHKLVEYDKFPVASYNAIHGTNFDPIDITKVHGCDLEINDRINYTYLLTYSFPCQDISTSGKGRGCAKGSGTRSGLLWEVERILDECGSELPQVLLMENVKNLLSETHKPNFDLWCQYLEAKGYKNYYKVMDSSNYGIPQHRERVFMVSIHGDYNYSFPAECELKRNAQEYMEKDVDESFYLTPERAKQLVDKLIIGAKFKCESMVKVDGI